ncbi:hypothetical protein F511_08008 [Dorcoceras hygrometricum]|uniref:Uncharacterized protein n=1 Tax=Dorcoceras hygrometricum TaxID=472368 RepID=A0A2Z7CFN1_9LAMI|nr:hypothetical protein F511_08008 [Dorcoceras hygrometricum]
MFFRCLSGGGSGSPTLISAIDSSILSVDCVEWLNILQQIVQQLFAQLLSILCHNTSRNSCFFLDWILCAWLPRFATSAFLASGYHVDWICNSTEARDWIHCSLRLLYLLVPSAKPSTESYRECKTLSYQLIQATSFCNRQLQTPTAGSGCPVVGREKLATGFPNDWLDQKMSYQLIQTTSFAMHPLLIEYNVVALDWIAPADLYRSSYSLRLFLASVPAGPFAPADLSSSAEHDVITEYIIIDGPLRCSNWFSFDVPADPSSSSSACSWFISFQLVQLGLRLILDT